MRLKTRRTVTVITLFVLDFLVIAAMAVVAHR
jgi:hypothetical protein